MTFGGGSEQEFIGKLTQITLDHLADEHFGGNELAMAMGVSWSTLNRKLQAITGQHISQFIRETRLRKALELLQENNATASEVAYKVGFGSPAYFSKCFNEFFGFPPGEVKKKLAEGTLPLPEEKQTAESLPEAENEPSAAASQSRFKKPFLIAASVGLGVLLIAFAFFYLARKEEFSYHLAGQEKSIAVLPFKNLSSEADNQYFADGITEDILNHLFRISDLRVISRTTAEHFNNLGLSTKNIAKAMDVNYLLEGSVRKQGDNVRITVQLIDGKSDRHLWSENYDRQLADIFFIQSDIAQNVVRELRAVLSPIEIEKLQTPSTTNPEAYNLYLMGRFYWYKMGPENIEKSIEYYEKAIALDPEFALAFSFLADSYLNKIYYLTISYEEGLRISESFAQKALAINPDLPEAYVVLGLIKMLEWNWEESHRLLSRAIKLNSNDAYTHYYYGTILSFFNELDEAHKHLDIAINLEPFQPMFREASMFLYFQEGNYLRSYEMQLMSLELAGNDPTAEQYWNLYATCNWLKDEKKAIEYLKKYFELMPDLKDYIGEIEVVYQKSGILGLKRWAEFSLLNKINNSGFYAINLAGFYAYLNEKDSVLFWLERSYENRENGLAGNIFQSFFKPYSSDPRFKAIIEKMGLTPYYYKDQQ